MAKAFIDDTNLTNIGNAIRNQNGTTTTYLPSEMADAINALPVLDTSDGTATANDLAEGTIAYVNGEQIVGSLEVKDSIYENNATPSYVGPMDITVDIPGGGTQTIHINESISLQTDISTRYIKDTDASVRLETYAGKFGDAKESDVANGKTFTSVNGLKLTGSLPDYKLESGDAVGSFDDNCMPIGGVSYETYNVASTQTPHIKVYGTAKRNAIIRKGQVYYHVAPAGSFGDATPADVASGKTFTSIEGLKLTGTATIGKGLDMSDATATASDIAEGATAYVNGKKVTGTVYTITDGLVTRSNVTIEQESNDLKTIHQFSKDRMFRNGTRLTLKSELSNFGDATAEDVAAGKTFTSVAGLKVTGTASSSSNNNSTVVSGTTTSDTIDTGLSSIDYIVIYKTSFAETGLIQGIYNTGTDTLNFVYCSSYSSYMKTCIASSSTASSVSEGIFTLGTSETMGLSSGVTYNWVAFGQA